MQKRILTWLQATSEQLHIGNYFGSIKSMLDLAQEFPDAEIFLFTAIMHTFTLIHNPQELKRNVMNSLKLFIACGVDPQRFTIYNPADIPAHAQLSRVFNCLTIMGTMERMHSYKEALDKGKKWEIGVGTFCYPILMAADILLYDADIVPTGKDQKQHVEYARDMAQKFNREYGDVFKIPEPYIRSEVAIVPGIDGRKMSKSYNNYIGLLDDEKTVLKKIKQIPTSAQTVEEPKDPDTCNVYNICKLFLTAEENATLRTKYQAGGLSFKEAKEYLYEKVITFLAPIQAKYVQISDEEIQTLLAKNALVVNEIAKKKIEEVYKTIGFSI